MRSLIKSLVLLFLFNTTMAQNPSLPQLGKNSRKEIISSMTLEEKVKLLVGNGFHMGGANPSGPTIGLTQDKVPGAAGTTYSIPRLGIPSMVLSDGPAGVRISPYRNKDSSRSYFATAYPIATLLASTWDTNLVHQVGASFGNEIHEYGIDIILAPALNIHRNPLGGRNFEYFSEDPLIAGSITAALVNGIQSQGVGTSIKHFAANNQETHRNTVNTLVSERALREIYLKGFEIAVKKSQPWTVMSSYNYLNGTYTSESYDLLTTILRKEWGFKGLVMTDWFGGKNPISQMKAGNDLLMPGTPNQTKAILSAIAHDSLSVQVIDENVDRVLRIIELSPAFKNYSFSNKPDLKEHASVSRMAASEGMILLRNESQSLPLSTQAKIALFGNTSYDIIAGGTGSGDVNKAYTISLAEGIRNGGFGLNAELGGAYESYIKEAKLKRPKPRFFFDIQAPIPEMNIPQNIIEKMAKDNDLAIFTIGRNSGEGADRKLDGDYYLSKEEKNLIHNLSIAFHAQGKKLIIVLNIAGVIETQSWVNEADGILLAWQPGLEAGNAITDVLSGKVNPSGKLATTFPMDYKDVPSQNFPGKEFKDKATKGMFGMISMPAEVSYDEGIYVGYRYYSTFQVKPAYEFGYGLSYTQFSYSDPKISDPLFGKNFQASITITNTGKIPGKEVVQLYLSAPGKSLAKPVEELKGFGKTKLLNPGESQTLVFPIHLEDLASFDSKSSSWIAEGGVYQVKIGSSSSNIKQSLQFSLSKEKLVEKVHKVLLPEVEIKELSK